MGRGGQPVPPQLDLGGVQDAIHAIRDGDLARAERLLKISTENFPDSPIAHYWLGVTYLKEHRAPEAELSLEEAIELRPDYPEAYDSLGVLYDEQGLYSKSELAFKRALALNPRLTNALITWD